jgi:hypothetical protein
MNRFQTLLPTSTCAATACVAPLLTCDSLRPDTDFDAVVAALYQHAGDYNLRENAFSAQVAGEGEAAEDILRRKTLKRRREAVAAAARDELRSRWLVPTVGRCRMMVSKPVLKALMVSALETIT